MNDFIALAAAALAHGILPAGYVALCIWLFRRRAWWFDYVAYFVLFGTAGGWCFAIEMSPGGIAAVSSLFLYTVAVVACVGSSVILTLRKKKSRAEWIAMISGYLYPGFLATVLIIAFIVERHHP